MKNGEILDIIFDNCDELFLVKTIIGNSYSGGSQWRISPESYLKKIGITYERAHQIYAGLAECFDKRIFPFAISISANDISAIKRATMHLMDSLEEEDFDTIIGVTKSKAKSLLDQLGSFI